MAPGFFVLLLVALAIGIPLLVVVLLLGSWMRRSQKSAALKPYLCAVIAGTVSFLAFFGAIAALIAIAVKEKRHPDYFDHHPFVPLLMIGLALLALGTALLCALFGAWTIWKVAEAPPALSQIAAPATQVPARSAG